MYISLMVQELQQENQELDWIMDWSMAKSPVWHSSYLKNENIFSKMIPDRVYDDLQDMLMLSL